MRLIAALRRCHLRFFALLSFALLRMLMFYATLFRCRYPLILLPPPHDRQPRAACAHARRYDTNVTFSPAVMLLRQAASRAAR